MLANVSPQVEEDNRPFAKIKILDSEINCLLDTGANQSVAGAEGTDYLTSLGLVLDRDFVTIMNTADKTKHLVAGVFYVPIVFRDIFRVIQIYSVPSVPSSIILGVNFFKGFNLLLYFDNLGWSCNSIALPKEVPVKHNGVVSYGELPPHQRSLMDETISKFKELGSGPLGCTPLMEHTILTGNALPIKQRGYPVSPHVQERMGKELKRMFELDVIERSFSPWSSPVVLVKKKDGRDRLCVDSRKLNSVTERDSYPLPRVQEILDRLGKTNFLSKIDLKDAFWQIPLSEDSKAKTAFSVPGHGLFQFKRLPFGLHNAAQCLQRLMNTVFGSTDHKIFVYLDDLVIASSTFEEHLDTLNFVLERLIYANLTINFEKSVFCCGSLAYLGYMIDKTGLHTDPAKVEAIINFPLPRTYTEMKRFIGLTSWYRRFVKDFSTIAAPLHELTKGKKKGKLLEWNPVAHEAFVNLKNCLVAGPVLATPDFTQRFFIHCDASKYGVGAVLCQGVEEHPIAFASRKFRGAEIRYATPEQECLAAVFAIDKFRQYIEGYEFTVITDCSALQQVFRKENPPGRLARWAMYLSQFKFNIIHRKGTSNVVPDVLSRTVNHLDLIEFEPLGTDEWYIKMLSKVGLNPTRFKDWTITDGKLYYKLSPSIFKVSKLENRPWCLVLPESARKSALKECHDSPIASHMGVKKTKAKVLERYYWPGAAKDVENYVKSCEICKVVKHPNSKRKGLMGKFKEATQPFQMISLDLMGPLPRSTKQNAWLLVVTDWFTKMPMLFPLRQATATKIVSLVENNIFLLFGVPEIVIADNGKQFTGREFTNLINKYAIKKMWFNSRYHPQNNPTERVNKTIGQALRAYVGANHRTWDANIPYIGLALRTAVNEITGFTPFYLNFARQFTYSGTDYDSYLNRPDPKESFANRVAFVEEFKTIFKDVSARIKNAYSKNKRLYDRNKSDVTFNEGDTVYKKNFNQSDAANYFSAKLAPLYTPCKVKKKISDLVYELTDLHGVDLGRWHIKDLKVS